MSSESIEDVKEQEFSDDAAENQVENDGDQKELDQNGENPMLSPEQEVNCNATSLCHTSGVLVWLATRIYNLSRHNKGSKSTKVIL